MASEASRSSRAADSYIGSLISLTSKFETRYEGILYNINTEESSIGLRNVRSFGTEGRKKDGPQVPQNDKVYEYILFRGSDIKDLQVKSSPPVQTQQPIHNDPAIMQSHYSQPASVSSSVPSASGGPITDPSSHTLQMGLSRSTFQGGVPLYQPEGSLGSWGSSPAPPSSANGGGLAMPPMYWQGFYGPSSGLSYVQQQPLLQSTPGLLTPQMVQQPTQYPGNAPVPIGSSNMPALNMPTSKLLGSTLPEFPPPLLPPVSSGSMNLTFGNLSSNMLSSMVPSKPTAISSETSPGLMPNAVPTSIPLSTSVSPSFPLVSQLTTSSSDVNAIVPPVSKPKTVPGMSSPYKTMPQSVSTNLGISSSHQSETSTPSLVTPDQLLQSGPTALSSSGPLKSASKDSEVVSESSSEPPLLASKDTHEPILPLPSLPNHKMNGAPLHIHRGNVNRGRGRGRGNGILHPVTKFTEDFDFMAMNEKFKKDEVWGHLGKANKMRNNNGNGEEDDGEDFQDEDVDVSESLNYDKKPVYVKDDFFDSLSCNALDRGQRSGRARFSEQMKIDTETFGDFPRYRAVGRGGRGQGRGGRSSGSYHGRGYAYVGRGRGQNH